MGLISIEETTYLGMYEREKELRAKAAEQEKRLDEQAVLITACDPAVPAIIQKMIRSASAVASYAVANMDPFTFKGWPTVDLRGLADSLRKLPVATEDDKQRAHNFDVFANEVDYVEGMRRQGREAELGEPAKGLKAQIEDRDRALAALRGRYDGLKTAWQYVVQGANQMELPGGDRCACGEPSTRVSGACSKEHEGEAQPVELSPMPTKPRNGPGI